jgi:hypothetical protein
MAWCLVKAQGLLYLFTFYIELTWSLSALYDLDCMVDVLMGFHRSTSSTPNTKFNPHLAPCDIWAFAIMKGELRGKKFGSDQRSAGRFLEVGGAL